jgi:DNA-binding NtrC family response regulator
MGASTGRGSDGRSGIDDRSWIVLVLDTSSRCQDRVARVLPGLRGGRSAERTPGQTAPAPNRDLHHMICAATHREVMRALPDPRLAIVVLADTFSESGPVNMLRVFKRERPDVVVVATSPRPSLDSGLACLRNGAIDYVASPHEDLAALRAALERALAHRRAVLALARRLRDTDAVEIPLSLEAYEKRALERALDESGGDVIGAARRLGIGRSTFYRKSARHGISFSGGETPRGRPSGRRRHRNSSIRGVGAPGSIG